MNGASSRLFGSLRAQLTLWFGGLSLLTVVGAGFYAGELAIAQRARLGGEQLAAATRTAAELLTAALGEREKEIDLLRQAPLLRSGDFRGADLRQVLASRREASEAFAWIGVAEPDGTVVAATGDLLVGQRIADRDWFRRARQGLFTGDVHDAVLLARLLPQARDDEPLRFVDVAGPVHDAAGGLRAVLGAHLHWSWVAATVERAVSRAGESEGIEVLILDRAGRVLYPRGLGAAPGAAASGAAYAILAWPDGQRYLTSGVGVAPTGRSDLGWRIVLRQPVDAALAPVRELRNQLVAGAVAVAALFAIVAHALAVRTSRPLERLTRAVERVGRGDRRPVATPPEGSDEVRRLAESVRSMTSVLLERESELARQAESLEATVAARTAELAQANEQLARLASVDALTGVANRRCLDERLDAQWRFARRTGATFWLVLVDVDRFKRINDTHGHPVGDAVLREFGRRLVGTARTSDLVARYGGEEFAILVPEPHAPHQALAFAERLRRAIAAAPFDAVGPLTASVGASRWEPGEDGVGPLLRRADAALYRAKQEGRDRCRMGLAGAGAEPGAGGGRDAGADADAGLDEDAPGAGPPLPAAPGRPDAG